MSIGTATGLALGKHHKNRLYAKIKNGNVYRYAKSLDPSELKLVIQEITNNNRRIPLKQWKRVR